MKSVVKRIGPQLGRLLLQGVAPGRLAASIAAGVALGMFPIVGTTTAIGFAVAFLLKLNVVALQLINWVLYPVQLALILPFFAVGARLFGAGTATPVDSGVLNLLRTDLPGALALLGDRVFHAVGAWAIAAIPVSTVAYVVAAALLKRYGARLQSLATMQEGVCRG